MNFMLFATVHGATIFDGVWSSDPVRFPLFAFFGYSAPLMIHSFIRIFGEENGWHMSQFGLLFDEAKLHL